MVFGQWVVVLHRRTHNRLTAVRLGFRFRSKLANEVLSSGGTIISGGLNLRSCIESSLQEKRGLQNSRVLF